MFGLKTPIYTPKIGFWGGFDTLNENERTPKRHILTGKDVGCIDHQNWSTGLLV